MHVFQPYIFSLRPDIVIDLLWQKGIIMTIVAGFVLMLVLVRLSTPTDSLAPCPGRRGINLLIESENSAFG